MNQDNDMIMNFKESAGLETKNIRGEGIAAADLAVAIYGRCS